MNFLAQAARGFDLFAQAFGGPVEPPDWEGPAADKRALARDWRRIDRDLRFGIKRAIADDEASRGNRIGVNDGKADQSHSYLRGSGSARISSKG